MHIKVFSNTFEMATVNGLVGHAQVLILGITGFFPSFVPTPIVAVFGPA
jgi:hypothetical protein